MPFLSHRGQRIHYAAPKGSPEQWHRGRTLLVLVHGFGGSTRHFDALALALGEHVLPLALDLPGCGQSAGEALRDVDALARFVIEVVDVLAPGAKVACLGHSFGGLIAAELALSYPQRVEQLVLLASSPRVRLHPEMARQALMRDWNEQFLRGSFGPLATEAQVQVVLEDLRAMRLPSDADAAMLARLTLHDVTKRLGSIRARTLVIVPTDDIIISPRHGKTWALGVPDARYVEIAGAGHYVQLENTTSVAHHVGAFLSERKQPVEREGHAFAKLTEGEQP